MKVNYKMIDRGASMEHYRFTFHILDIEFCCDEMKEAYDGDAIRFGEFESDGLNINNRVNIAHCHYGCDEYALKYCPFCGKEIEVIEKEKVKLVEKSKIVPKKVYEYEEVPI